MALQLTFGEASAIGPRAENQDAIRVVTPAPALAASKGYLFALADGVSQCADGGLAARATLQALALDYYSTPETWAVTQSLDRLLVAHNRWLQANGGGQPLLTTLTALVLRGRRFTLAHVGDCRAYRWQQGLLERISEDHVWEQPGMQHVLKRAMGLDQHLVVDYLDGELREGECFVLASDGVWATLGDNGIQQILHDEQDLAASGGDLFEVAHGVIEKRERLFKVDNVNVAAGTENKRRHLGGPVARLVAKVNTGLQHLTHRDVRHQLTPNGNIQG